MELRHIRYFLAVAEERHFTRAATKLGIGQPPLSQQIKDLERELGAQLFRRVPHGAELTEAGKAFYDVVKGMPATATRAVLAAQRVARGESGVLRVGFTASAAFNSVVPGAIRTFKRVYPDVRLQLEEGNTTQLADELNEGSLDVAFLRPGFTGNERFQLRLLSEEPMVIVLAETHPAAACKQIALSILKDEFFLLFPREIGLSLYDAVIKACGKAGFEPKIGQLVPQISSVINLVSAEMGVSMVPDSMRQVNVKGVVYRPVADQMPVAKLALAYRRGDTSPTLRNFILKVTG
ncbi:itaconate degradation transcriptional regulator RipR [Salmonella enterica]|nr:LysR family transcriptional regulator [Salmonella enterica subsp. enterica serovar Enteritidis]EAV6742523.1 LysR family transcriptional regulator [Salmonella enterica]EEK2976760.1 LysR family transcriptional regulator [Salmonella enterica subsp. enterica serovar 7:d:z35]EEK3004039.1 LysR family transcriptional regulator [Salmonella enterica subsp. diarizonae serovar 38:[k]:z35:-]EAZ5912489.1 LysR family transcriptional regulator [Salmonella enterica]